MDLAFEQAIQLRDIVKSYAHARVAGEGRRDIDVIATEGGFAALSPKWRACSKATVGVGERPEELARRAQNVIFEFKALFYVRVSLCWTSGAPTQ